MKRHAATWTKWFLMLVLLLGSVTATTAVTPATVAHATTVYVTRTGKHYFYNKHDRGLNRAKKVYAVSLTTAKHRGLTLSGTEKAPAKRKVVKKKTVKKVAKKKKVTKKKAVKKTTKKKVAKKKPAKKKKAVKKTTKKVTTKYRVKVVNKNRPGFSKATLSIKKGPWQKYGQLDVYNRATAANALLNKKLMPTAKREALYINPTGWHNKRIRSGWLYNRSHLIGYQLTGQNNNMKNLITGTRQLNDPGMSKYENKVAAYLKASPKHYVRYRVTPVFKNHELLARGVKMQAQSIGSKKIKFNLYLPNTQPGMKLNYANGLSKVAK
ncbi:DNA/RNA non-specific endonuclease [Lactiplantibacillus paraxiangfangensis]|uniref:DNA/RNA non-specific endonuclease n=1 Tax=Lactiplantibacillus paraxiangfangensis TaxID=3076224 RepID=UPI0030C69D76